MASELDKYFEHSQDLISQMVRVLDRKSKALDNRDINEVYRLAGVLALMVKKVEEYDRTIFLAMGGNAGAGASDDDELPDWTGE